jgi:Protein of unknown function TPD sequence-motif
MIAVIIVLLLKRQNVKGGSGKRLVIPEQHHRYRKRPHLSLPVLETKETDKQIVSYINMENAISFGRIDVNKYKSLPPTAESVVKIFNETKANPNTIINRMDWPRTLIESPKLGMFSKSYQQELHNNAKHFEVEVEKYFKSHGVEYKTEDMIKAENPGATATPDLLFESNVYMATPNKSIKLFWVDAKNYPYYDSVLVRSKLAKQYEKYTNAFGAGAFIFNGIWEKCPYLSLDVNAL